MPYTTQNAKNDLFAYLAISEQQVQYINDTNNRGMVLTLPSGTKVVLFLYPLVHKLDNTKNYFDTRESGAYERGVSWNYALTNKLKYFCLGVNASVDKYQDYVFSLECSEATIEQISGTKDGKRSGPGNQIIIPNDYKPSKLFDRFQNRLGIFICAIHKDSVYDYLEQYDNRPYMVDVDLVDLSDRKDATSVDNESAFKNWLELQVKDNGGHYSENTIYQYLTAIKAVPSAFLSIISPFTSVFEVDSSEMMGKIINDIKADPGYEAFNKSRGNGSLSACLELYKRFLDEQAVEFKSIRFSTGLSSIQSRNRILFGAPGTGKSFTLKNDAAKLLANGGMSERVTFHPDYSYANFVGTYKPVPSIDSDGKDAITYKYVPGPFMRVYVKALKNSREFNPLPHLLIIEEINRANVAAVFGDVFQLLDRDDEEVSEYPIQASEDIKKYLASELGGDPEDYAEIRIPDNMFIWATMNSADQGVFPMDTAFKRRWDFTYLGIDDSEAGIVGKTVILGKGEYRRVVEWNALRKAINEELLTYKVNEDKLMGPYFISKKNLPEGNVIDPVEFTRIFKNKVIMYLFDDAAKQKRVSLFGGCDEKAKYQYSKICSEFDTKGVFIFCEDIRKKFIEIPEGTEE